MEFFSEVVAGAEEEAFDGRDGGFQDGCDVLVGHFFVATEHECQALSFGQGLDGGLDVGFEFGLQGDVVGRGGGGVLELAWVAIRVLGFESYGGFAFSSSCFVEDQVACDGHQPGGELGGGFVVFGGFPNPHENLLGDVFCFG